MIVKWFVLLILAMFASETNKNDEKNDPEKYGNIADNPIVVKIEENEHANVNKKSEYIGVTYYKRTSKWKVQRRSKNENKMFCNGYYSDERTAAHASDTLARKLMKNGEQTHKLNFPEDRTEVYPEENNGSKFIGVTYNKNSSKWCAQRWNKKENKIVNSGYYNDEEKPAHASDNLARKFMENGEQEHKLNFPDDRTEVYPEEKKCKNKFIGVSYNKNTSKWFVQRRTKHENKIVLYGYYDDEETAAHASDTLARELMRNGEQDHKLNFPDEYTEVHADNQNKKRKRPKD